MRVGLGRCLALGQRLAERLWLRVSDGVSLAVPVPLRVCEWALFTNHHAL